MRSKPYTEIESLSPNFVAEIVERSGVPDNIVESAEGAIVGLPDLDADPKARIVMDRLDGAIRKLTTSDDINGDGSSADLRS